MTTIPFTDVEPVSSDDWLGTYGDIWPYGRSNAAKLATPVTTVGTAASPVTLTLRPNYTTAQRTALLPVTVDSDGAFRIPDDTVILGNIDCQNCTNGIRFRRLACLNPWFEGKVLASYMIGGFIPPFADFQGDWGIPTFAGSAVDGEDFLSMGLGGTTNEMSRTGARTLNTAYQITVTGAIPTGATLSVTIDYWKGGTSFGTVTIGPISTKAGYTGGSALLSTAFDVTQFNTALDSVPWTGSSAPPNSPGTSNAKQMGLYVKGNGAFTLEHNDGVTTNDGNNPVRVTKGGPNTGTWTVTVTSVKANMSENGQIGFNGCTNLQRLATDPVLVAGRSDLLKVTGLQRAAFYHRMADFAKGQPNEFTAWHMFDYGLHTEREGTFGGNHIDSWQFTGGGNPITKLPYARFWLTKSGQAALFAADSNAQLNYAIAANMLLAGNGAGSKMFFLSRRGTGAMPVKTGLVDSRLDPYTRNKDWQRDIPTTKPRYGEVDGAGWNTSPTGGSIVWDGVRESGGSVDLNFTKADLGAGIPTGFSTTILAKPTDMVIPAPWDPNATGGVDNTAPTAPTSLALTANTVDGATIHWTQGTDAVGVVKNRIYRGDTGLTLIEEITAATSYTITGLPVKAGGYKIVVTAMDAAGNQSVQSNQITIVPTGTPTSTIGATGLSPTALVPPATLTITGTNFVNVTNVRLNGADLTGYTVVSATQITVPIPDGSVSGTIEVVTSTGTSGQSTQTLTVNYPPTINSISPTQGIVGSTVTIDGTHLDGVTSVKFNGGALNAPSFTIVAPNRIDVVVPATVATGTIVIAKAYGGTATSTIFTLGAAIVRTYQQVRDLNA